MCEQAIPMGMQRDILQQRCSVSASQEGRCPHHQCRTHRGPWESTAGSPGSSTPRAEGRGEHRWGHPCTPLLSPQADLKDTDSILPYVSFVPSWQRSFFAEGKPPQQFKTVIVSSSPEATAILSTYYSKNFYLYTDFCPFNDNTTFSLTYRNSEW